MSAAGRGNFKMALASLRSSKWRSLLTMSGVIIGVVSVVMVVGIGQGVKQQVTGQANHFGKDLITVRPGIVHPAVSKQLVTNSDVLFGRNQTSSLTIQDVDAIKRSNHVQQVAPLGLVSGSASFAGRKASGIQVYATSADLASILQQNIQYGSFFTNDPQAGNAVIGSNVAMRLFNERVPLGQTFVFRGQSLIVRGVFDSFHASPLAPTAGFDDAIFVPYQMANQVTNGGVQFYTILAKPDDASQLKSAMTAINNQMNQARGGEQDFSVLDQKSSVAMSSNIIDILTAFIVAVAAIALLVGGIGIMNIMLLSVTERMHEIGIRKAIGATNRQILGQFVLEAATLSGAGGILGVVLSFVIAWILRTYTSYQPIITWQPVVIATLVSTGIGILFGAAPAFKAARKDPIEALRHE